MSAESPYTLVSASACLAARSACWSCTAFITADVAAPMKAGRLAAAQPRDSTARVAEPWNSG